MLKKIFFIIVAFVLIVGAYAAYRTHESVKSVNRYAGIVDSVLAQKGLSQDRSLVLAIIYQETKGGETDVMQSSESVTGQQNTTANSDESIENGVTHLAEVLNYAQEKNTDVWTGVQAYNFGKSYVDYVAAHGCKNTLKLAEAYSKNVVAPSLGNTTGATYKHITFDSFFYNGGRLYKDGGNFFYAREVKEKMFLIRHL